MINQPQTSGGNESSPDLHGLLFETSPYGNLDAIVQHDNRAVYLYLNGDEPFGTRACWLQNLVDGPLVLNQQEMESGLPPLMPKTHTIHSGAQPIPDPNDLQTVWFEEGNGIALFERDKLLAVIPPWSGVDGFHGYSANCAIESPIAWPLVDNENLVARINNAKQFWKSCQSEKDHPFAVLQPNLLSIYNKAFNDDGQYFALDGGHFPPRGAMVYRNESGTTIVSVGMSLRPQPNVEMSVEQPASLRRIEMGIELNESITDDHLHSILEQFSGLVAYPWQAFTWFGHGHTCEFPQLKPLTGVDSVRFETALLSNPDGLKLPEFRGDPVQLLWLVPADS